MRLFRMWSHCLSKIFSPTAMLGRAKARLAVERLEDRFNPASFSVGYEAELRSAIVTANTNSDTINTITLTADISLEMGNGQGSGGQENFSAFGDLDLNNQNPSIAVKTYVINGGGFTIDASTLDDTAGPGGSPAPIAFSRSSRGPMPSSMRSPSRAVTPSTAAPRRCAGDEDAHGGGVLNDGTVSFTSATVKSNQAVRRQRLRGEQSRQPQWPEGIRRWPVLVERQRGDRPEFVHE